MDVRRLILLVGVGLLASCGNDAASAPSPSSPAAPTLKAIAFATTSLTIPTVGQTAQLQVIGTYSDGSTRDLTSADEFESSRIDVATASRSGLVTAWAPGTTRLTALETASGALGAVATATLTVANGPPADPILVPTLLSPDDDATVPAAPTGILTLNWSSVPGATAYHLSLDDTNALFPALDRSDIPNPPWQVATGGIASNNFAGWHWSVQAQVNGVFQAWSAVRTFNYVAATPAHVDVPRRASFVPVVAILLRPMSSRR